MNKPQILLLGDSIRMGYCQIVKELLKDETIENADYTVLIPMSHCVDSLNVAAASAVAFWELCK